MELSSTPTRLSFWVEKDSIKVPASDEEAEDVVHIGQLWRSLRRHQSIGKTALYRHPVSLRCR